MDMDTMSIHLARLMLQNNYRLACAESCTGGWISQQLTSLSGSSQWFERGFVTYSNQAKHEMLSVPMELIDEYGAVSEPCVIAMVTGAIQHSHANVAVAVSGIAGPTGGTPDKPVGTVWLAWQQQDHVAKTRCKHFVGDRKQIRYLTVVEAIQGLIDMLRN